MASTFTYISNPPTLDKKGLDNDSLEDDDLSSLSDLNDDNSLDEYFEDDLIPDEDNDTSVISSIPDDEVVVIPGHTEGNYTDADYSWRTGYTMNWKSYGNHNTSNNSNVLGQDFRSGHIRSISDEGVSQSKNPAKKKLSVGMLIFSPGAVKRYLSQLTLKVIYINLRTN